MKLEIFNLRTDNKIFESEHFDVESKRHMDLASDIQSLLTGNNYYLIIKTPYQEFYLTKEIAELSFIRFRT